MRQRVIARFLIVVLLFGNLIQFIDIAPSNYSYAVSSTMFDSTSSGAIVTSQGAITIDDLVAPEIDFDSSKVTSNGAIYIDITDNNPPEAEYMIQVETDTHIEKDLKQISSGYYFTFGIDNGVLYGWGRNSNGQLGLGHTNSVYSPTKVALPQPALKISAGYKHAIVLMANGQVAVWGDNGYGQLGDSTTTDSAEPIILDLENIVDVSAGYYNSYAVDKFGNVYGGGRNSDGQLGINTTASQYEPTQMSLLESALQVEAGYKHVLVLTSNGDVYSVGENAAGQLGLGDDNDRLVPTKINLDGTAKDIGTDYKHSGAVLTDGRLAMWGYNSSGQLGDGETSFKMSPVYHEFDKKVEQISVGRYHSIAILEDGGSLGAGDNGSDQLFNASGASGFTSLGLPRLVSQMDSGYKSNVVAISTDEVYGFGNNSNGELGNGNAESSLNLEKSGHLNVSDLSYFDSNNLLTNMKSWNMYESKEVDISSFKSNTAYRVTPFVRAEAGDIPLGGPSISVFIITEPADPPENLHVVENTSETMTLTWNEVGYVNDYSLEVNGNDVYSTSDTSYKLTGLQSNQEYEIRIRSNNSIGQGEWSKVQKFRTKAGIMDYQLPSEYQLNGVRLSGNKLTLDNSFEEQQKSIIFYSTFENAGIYDFSEYEIVVVADTDVDFNKNIRSSGAKVFQYIAYGSRFEDTDAFVEMIKSEIQNFKNLGIADGIFFDEVSVGYWGSGLRDDPEKIQAFAGRLDEITDYMSSIGLESIVNGSTGFAKLGDYYLWESFLGTFGEKHFIWSLDDTGRTANGVAGIDYFKSINDWTITGDVTTSDTINGSGPATLEILVDTENYLDPVDKAPFFEWMDLIVSGENLSSSNVKVQAWLGDSLPFDQNTWHDVGEVAINEESAYKIRDHAKYVKLKVSIDETSYTIDKLDMWFDRNFEYYDVVSDYTPGEHRPHHYEYNLSKRDYLQNVMEEYGTRIFTHTFGESGDIEKMRYTRLASQIWGFYTSDYVHSHRILTDTSNSRLNIGMFLKRIGQNTGRFTGGTVTVDPETQSYNIISDIQDSQAVDSVIIDGDMSEWTSSDVIYSNDQRASHIYPRRFKIDDNTFEGGIVSNLKEVFIDGNYGIELITDGSGSWTSPVIQAHDENSSRIGVLTRFYDQILNDGSVTYQIKIKSTSGVWSGWQPLSYDATVIGEDFKAFQYKVNITGMASDDQQSVKGIRLEEARVYRKQYLPRNIEVTNFSIKDDVNDIYMKFDVSGEVAFTDIGKISDYNYAIYLNTLGDKNYGYTGKYYTSNVGANYKIENGSLYIWDKEHDDPTDEAGWIELGDRSPLVYFSRSADKASIEMSISKNIVNLNQDKLFVYMRLQERTNWTNNYMPAVTNGRSSDVKALEYNLTNGIQNINHGYYLSQAVELKANTNKVMIDWTETLPSGTFVDVWVRQSKTDTWDEWRQIHSGEPIDVSGEYIQYVVSLSSTEANVTPEVTEVEINEWQASGDLEFVKIEPHVDRSEITWIYDTTSGSAVEIEIDGVPTIVDGDHFTHSGLNSNEMHSYRFRPYTEDQSFEWSQPYTIYTLLEAPSGYSVAKTLEVLTVDWESVSGASEYDVQINGNAMNASNSLVTIDEILPGQIFDIYYRAKNDNTYSDWKAALGISTMPDRIGDLTGQPSSNKIDLSWSEITNTDFYELEINGNVFEVSPGQTNFTHRTNKVIEIDGNVQDWYDIKDLAKSDDKNYMKALRSGENLYVLLVEEGLSVNDKYRILLNTDSDSNTGFVYHRWASSGFDILIENGRLYEHSGDSDKYDWTFIELVDQDRSTNTAELKVDLSNMIQVSDELEIAMWTNSLTLPDEDTLPANVVDASLEANTEQSYRIRGYNATGYGQWSEILNVKTILAPVENMVMDYLEGNLSIEWTQDPEAVSYDVEIDGTVYNTTETSYILNGVENNHMYTVRIRSNSLVEPGEWTELQEITTPLGQVTDLYTSLLEKNYVELSWTSDPDALAYEVDIDGSVYSSPSTTFKYSSDREITIDGQDDEWVNVVSEFEDQSQKKMSVYLGQESVFIFLKSISGEDSPRVILDSDGDISTGYSTSYWSDSGAEYLIENDRLYSYAGTGQDYTWNYIGSLNAVESSNGIEIEVPYSQIDYTDINDMKVAYWDDNTHMPEKYSYMLNVPRKTLVSNAYHLAKVRAVNGGLDSEWSDPLQVLTPIDTPEIITFNVDGSEVVLIWDTMTNSDLTEYQVTLVDTSSNTIELVSDWIRTDRFTTSSLSLGDEYHIYLSVRDQNGDATNAIDFGVHKVRKVESDTISVTEDKKRTVTLSASNIRTFATKKFKLVYDPSKLGLVDLSTYTLEEETSIGVIGQTPINITNVQAGEITFEINTLLNGTETWSGILNVVEFIGLDDGISEIQFIVE
ncbi:fibronectin type III domain-containing protein [Fusibacter sp. JL216-2]|uniref:RCC1 domain-containing protein n=1 Tax=Fusibacter sp. JL216-2 TaxID=3071453 RepID=UPI003D34B521